MEDQAQDHVNQDDKYQEKEDILSHKWVLANIPSNVESYFLEGFSFGLNDIQEYGLEEDTNNLGILVEDFTTHFLTDKVFESRIELFDWCQVIARSLNTLVVKLYSEKESHRRKGRLVLGCERAGLYRSKTNTNDASDVENKKRSFRSERSTCTKKCGCPFKLKGVPLGDDRWKVEVICGSHNHVIPKTLIGHAYAGRLRENEKKVVRDMSLCGVKPKQILVTLKNGDVNNLATLKTVYNERSYSRLKDLGGRSIVKHLMKMLDEKHYIHYSRSVSDTDELVDIFWAHPDSVLLARCFPSVVLVDCTDKTNRYNLPLLQIVGCTSTSKTFCLALALIHHERQENYEWAYIRLRELFDPNALPNVFVSDREQASMNAIEKVFPDARVLLFCFHIAKNVSGKCKPVCSNKKEFIEFMRGWTAVTEAETEIDFNENWKNFKENTPCKFSKCLVYIAKTWLIHKERFVRAWTNSIKHRGNTTTNRVEGAHSKLKKWLASSQGTFPTLWQALDNLLKVEISEIRADFEQNLMRVRHAHKFPEFKYLRSHVSHFALDLIVEEMTRVQYIGLDEQACGHVARTVYGVPCAHELIDFKNEGRQIPIDAIDNHWRKLSLVPEVTKVDYEPEMQAFKKKWENATPDEKMVMLKKIEEIACPSTTSLVEPTPIVAKGRPKLKMSAKEKKHVQSTKRDPSWWEREKLNSKSTGKEVISKLQPQTEEKRPRLEIAISKDTPPVRETIPLFPFHPVREDNKRHLDKIPQFILPFVAKMVDVDGDGNCGYRCVGDYVGYEKENGWKKVRYDLTKEVLKNRSVYERLFSKSGVVEILDILKWYEGGNSPSSKWMLMPAMDYIASSAYNMVFVFISARQCLTFMPLFDAPNPDVSRAVFTLAHVNGNHFMKLFLNADSPIPPIASFWHKYHVREASLWPENYDDRINSFRKIVPRDIAVTDSFVDL